jgi:hypothetical protein
MLVETSTVRPEERDYGWRVLGFVHVVVSEHPIFSSLTFRCVNETEACPDALVRDTRDRSLVLRDLENDGLPDTLLIYCFRDPLTEATADFLAAAGLSEDDVLWRNWVVTSAVAGNVRPGTIVR